MNIGFVLHSNIERIHIPIKNRNRKSRYILSDWDVSNVVNMESMFEDCSGLLDSSDLSGWNVSNVTHMEDMFKGCKSLEEYPEWYSDDFKG